MRSITKCTRLTKYSIFYFVIFAIQIHQNFSVKVPFNDNNALRDWLYNVYVEKDKILGNFALFTFLIDFDLQTTTTRPGSSLQARMTESALSLPGGASWVSGPSGLCPSCCKSKSISGFSASSSRCCSLLFSDNFSASCNLSSTSVFVSFREY